MVSPQQSRQDLAVVSGEAVDVANELAGRLQGSPEAQRLVLLDNVPAIIDYYAAGAGVLAADFYDERRELAGVKSSYMTEIIAVDRTVKIRRAVAWAAEPLFEPMTVTLEQRLAKVVQPEVARAYRDTILENRRRDPATAGWRRVTGVCCGFCRMLADKGAIYKRDTAQFAAHPHCDCGAEPMFQGQAIGPEANNFQYMASKRTRTPAERARLREYISMYYPD